MGRIHAVLSDGTVVTDVEVCPIFYLFLFSVVVYLLCALSHYMFSFLSKFESSIASPSCIFLCVCMCKHACVHVVLVNMNQFVFRIVQTLEKSNFRSLKEVI